MSHRRLRGNRSMIVVILTVLLTALVGCTGSSPAPPPPERPVEPGFLITYAAAAGRLDSLDPVEADDQLRDWARIGLAAYLEMDTVRLRDATYDTLPVRDTGLTDLVQQPTGPGRALYDGNGVLHLLVPRENPHRDRTIGLLLDQYRADAGADPPQVQVHDYEILAGPRAIAVTTGKPTPTAEVRAANGYVSMRVDEIGGLTDFLAKTRHLSALEVREGQVWAEGWNWPDVPAVPMNADDVSVVQRGYAAVSGPLPGFSLDPGPPETAADLLAIVPGLSPELADAVAARDGNPTATELWRGVRDSLYQDAPPPAGLSSDRTRLWALLQALEGRPVYAQARYDGPLAGTDVGMTLFYVDYEAKNWANGVGDGVPDKAVPGFVANSGAATPWGHCPEGDQPMSESGRLWFGQAESGFAFDTNRVNISAQATRLFAKSDGEGDTEIEPSYAFGRGLKWWDQHFQAIADYEFQYQRLEQIMRWSGALEWLVTTTSKQLPESGDPASPGRTFADWYAQHNELHERSPIDLVKPPSATQEAVLHKPSKTYTDCGFTTISGGVSLGDLVTRQGGKNYHAELPASVRRAGVIDPRSTFDPLTGTGRIKELSLGSTGKVESYRERAFSPVVDGKAAVETTGSGRRIASLGDLKVQADPKAPRRITNEISADRGRVTEQVDFQGQDLGTLAAQKDRDSVSIGWQPGPVDTAMRAVRSCPLCTESGPETLLSHRDSHGRTLSQLGGLDGPWLETTRNLTPPGGALTFRMGAPHPQGGIAEFALGTLRGPPRLGGPNQTLSITPASAGHPATIAPAAAPGPGARAVSVATPDGNTFNVYRTGDRWSVRHKDLARFPEFAAALAKFDDLDPVRQQVRVGYRAYHLDGNGVALVGADEVIVVSNLHPWASEALNAIVPGQPAPLFHIEGKNIKQVDEAPIMVEPGTQAIHQTLGDALNQGKDVYLIESARTTYALGDGPYTPDVLPRGATVVVVPARVQVATGAAWQPEVRVYEGARWQRVSTGSPPGLRGSFLSPGLGTVQTPPPSPTMPTTTSTSGTTAPPAMGSLAILLVCPDTDPARQACGS